MDYSALLVFVMGPLVAKFEMTGIELKIFNFVTSFRTAEDMARDMGAHPENTRDWDLGKQILHQLRKSLSPFGSGRQVGIMLFSDILPA